MLTPQTLTAAVATFTGVWALFLSGLTPVTTAAYALRPNVLVATSKELLPRDRRSVLAEARELTEPQSTEATTTPAAPKPHAKPRIATTKHHYVDHL